jgi:beta-hexosaminidase Fdl
MMRTSVTFSGFFFRPTERTWTYKCVNSRCVRSHHNRDNGDKRVTFLTCTNTCSPPNVWPMPSKPLIGTNSKNFLMQNVNYNVEAPSEVVENLMNGAIEIFLDEIKQISYANGAKIEPSTTRRSRSNKNSSPRTDVTVGSHQYLNNLSSVRIAINVIKSTEVHLTLNTDECYNMTISNDHSVIKVDILANSFFGARNGLSTLFQLIWYDDEDDVLKIITTANIFDCPKFA